MPVANELYCLEKIQQFRVISIEFTHIFQLLINWSNFLCITQRMGYQISKEEMWSSSREKSNQLIFADI